MSAAQKSMLIFHNCRSQQKGLTVSIRSKYRTLSGLYFLCAFLIWDRIFALWPTALAAGTSPGVSMKRTRIPLMVPSSNCTCGAV